MNDCLPMMTIPGWVTDGCVFDFLKILALDRDGYGQLRKPGWRLDDISVSPIPSRVLHVIE